MPVSMTFMLFVVPMVLFVTTVLVRAVMFLVALILGLWGWRMARRFIWIISRATLFPFNYLIQLTTV